MKNNKWTPKNLSKTQEKALESNDFNELERYGDFGSYRRVLLGDDVEDSMLRFHNSLKPGPKVDFCHGLLKRSADNVASVLDVGCGMGYTANEISRLYPNARVLAVDISEDAVTLGRKTFSGVDFVCQSIEPENPALGQFDIIYAFEFYPFTRTSELNIHLNYIKYFLSQLNPDGHLLIHLLWNNSESIYTTLSRIKKNFLSLNFPFTQSQMKKYIEFLKLDF